jgi:SAM-dependent methyltransferase
LDRGDWNQRYAASDLVWGHEPNRFVAQETSGIPPTGRALDLACGEGRNAIWLAERGWRVTGVDYSDVAIERARELAARRGVEVEWICDDLRKWAPPRAAFELVLIAYLQVPWDDMQRALGLAAGALASSGQLVMIGHARRMRDERVSGPSDPAVRWDPDEIAVALRALGLQVDRCEHVVRPVEQEGGVCDALDVLARARRPQPARAA